MPRTTTPRTLVGPVSARVAARQLDAARRAGNCLTFGRTGTDVLFNPGDSWAELSNRLPAGWAPDCIVLILAYNALPVGIWPAPLPLIGYAADWPLHWHYYRRLAPHLDLIWTDARGTELFQAAGLRNVRAVVPLGRPTSPPGPDPAAKRDLDLVWVGNFNPAIHGDRLPWVVRVARFSERYRVRIVPGLDTDGIRPLFERARVAFLPSFQGGWDGLLPEALAAGTVVLRDAPVAEVPGGLTPGVEYIAFNDDNLESVVESILANEEQRLPVATAGQARAREFGAEAMWSRAMDALAMEWDDIQASVPERVARSRDPEMWEVDHWQYLGAKLTPHNQNIPFDHAARQLAIAVRLAWGDAETRKPSPDAAELFRKLLSYPETRASALLHLGEHLTATGRPEEGVAALRQATEAISGREKLSSLTLGVGPVRPGFNAFRVEWERTGWKNPTDPAAEEAAKRRLLRARCELLLGQSTADRARVVRAARLAPNYLPALEAAGPAALLIDDPAAAGKFLARATAEHPFDNALAREHEKVLTTLGDTAVLEQFRKDRWFLAHTRGNDVPSPVPAVPRRERISLTMIVKDEAANLPACLDSVRDLVDELIVVDTGSTDQTPEIARTRGARVVHFPWRDDFAAARNAGLDAAGGDWIFWLDADEQLGSADRDKAKRLFKGLRAENAAYLMRQLSPSVEPGGAKSAVDQVRLFRRRPDVRWEYRIHEQILLSIRRTDADVRTTNIVIAHSGYHNAELCDRKMQRNLRLLELAHQEQPADAVLAFNLAQAYHKAGQAARALPLLEHCRDTLAPRVSIVPKVYRLLGQTLERLGRPAEAQEAFTAGRKGYPEDIELLLHHGLFLQREKDYPGAEACFRRILAIPPGTYPVGIDLGLLGYKTRNALAELFQEQKRWAEAKDQWLIALAEEPAFVHGRVGLAAVAIAQGLRREATEILDKLGPLDPIIRPQVARLRRILSGQTAKDAQ
jgi:tetratricopeptide (TPR) repeat protein